MLRLVASGVAGIALAGCESWGQVIGDVRVPVEVQDMYTADAPAAVLVVVDAGVHDQLRLGHLCDAGSEMVTFGFNSFEHGCPEPGDVTAWAEAVEAPAPDCGPQTPFGVDGALAPDASDPQATVDVFADAGWGCGARDEEITLTLVIPD